MRNIVLFSFQYKRGLNTCTFPYNHFFFLSGLLNTHQHSNKLLVPICQKLLNNCSKVILKPEQQVAACSRTWQFKKKQTNQERADVARLGWIPPGNHRTIRVDWAVKKLWKKPTADMHVHVAIRNYAWLRRNLLSNQL